MASGEPSKRQKGDISSELKPDVNLRELKVEDINSIWSHYTASVLTDIESCYHHEFQDGFVRLQNRLYSAQSPRHSRLADHRANQIGSKLPKPTTAKKLGILLGQLSRHPDIKSNVKDCIRYYEACCVGVGCFMLSSGLVLPAICEMAGQQEPVEYYTTLIEASERFFRSSSASDEQIVTPNQGQMSANFAAQVVPAVTSVSTAQTTKSNETLTSTHEPYSDEYLKAKAASFVIDKKTLLERAMPWEEVDDCDCSLKQMLEDEYDMNNSGRKRYVRTPPGILLHGDQGTGKTSIVESFAAHKGLTYFRVGNNVQGSLRGQSEKLLTYIFNAVRIEAAQGQCVLLFDEVDGLLGESKKDLGVESMMKELWGDLINDKVQCFIFGATNKPWALNMADWGRRFARKVHVKVPKPAAREKILKYSLSGLDNNVSQQELDRIVVATASYSANDIASEVLEIARRLQLEEIRGIRADVRPMTGEMILERFEGDQVQMTCSPEVERRHNEWNAQFRRGS